MASLAELGRDDLLGRAELLPLIEEAVDKMCPELPPDAFGEGAELGDVFRVVEGNCSKVCIVLSVFYCCDGVVVMTNLFC